MHGRAIRDVRGQDEGMAARTGDERRGLRDLIGGSRQDGDIGPGPGQGTGGGPADSPAGSGHEGYLPAKVDAQIHNNG